MKNRFNKRGMVSQMQGIAFGIIGLVILVGIGLVVLGNLEKSVSNCENVATCGSAAIYNLTSSVCSNGTAANCGNAAGTAYTALVYGGNQLGSTGLLSWLPAIIALLVGVFFLSYFAGNKKEY